MNQASENQKLLDRLIESVGSLPAGWAADRAASYLLAGDEPEAKKALRQLAPNLLRKPYLADRGYWQDLESWLERTPVERCLAHVAAFQSVDALAMLTVDDAQVESVFDTLLGFADGASKRAEPLWGLYALCAIWLLHQADPSTATRLFARIKPSRWIERFELKALADRLGVGVQGAGYTPARPAWVRHLHPAIARDPLGGALTRVALTPDPYDVIGRDLPNETPGDWLLYADLDGLKRLNDQLGHLGGDLAIWGVIQTLQEALGDRVIRFGGEEFVILHDGPHGPELAESLRRSVEVATYEPLGHLEQPVQVTLSFGVARGGNLQEALRAAEDAVNEAKLAGRNRVVVAS